VADCSGWVDREVEEVVFRREEEEDWKLGFESVKRENRLSVGAEGAIQADQTSPMSVHGGRRTSERAGLTSRTRSSASKATSI